MSLQVFWSPTAKDEYAELLAHLESNFGIDSALSLLDKTEAMIQIIEAFPFSFPISQLRSDLRKAVLSPQTSLLYRVTDTQIQLLHFWDNRGDPNRLFEW